jgi:hypothetical protein
MLVVKNSAREGFHGHCVQREYYSWPEGRKKMDHLGLAKQKS